MVKQVDGYMTSQGRFFTTQREANLSETYHQLADAIETRNEDGEVSIFMSICRAFPHLVHKYIDALIELLPEEQFNGHDNKADEEAFETGIYDEDSDEVARPIDDLTETEAIDPNEPIEVMDLGEHFTLPD